ncbi:MAG: hypothetical protein AAF682_28080 [Planctomycetota bacterium]
MTQATNQGRARRTYTRRSDEERIAELEAKITEIRERQERKKRKDDPVLKDIPKVQRRLRKFSSLAVEAERLDISNMVTGWVSSLDRMLREDTLKPASLEALEDEEEETTTA